MRAIRTAAFAFLPSLVVSGALAGQTPPGTIPAGAPLIIALDHNFPMRVGAKIDGTLLYPVYADNTLLLPKDTPVTGSVIGLRSDHSRRVRAALGGDFTPFRTPEVRFDSIVLADGSRLPMGMAVIGNGSAIYRAVAPPPVRGGLLRREFGAGLSAARRDIATFTAAGKGDRLLQFVYARLPYHPQRIEAGTAWTVETNADVLVPAQPMPIAPSETMPAKRHFWQEPAPVRESKAQDDRGAWIVQASLTDPLSSETSHTGATIEAVVAEPIYAPDHTLAVPQGATLKGTVTRARRARSFGRTGVLSFNFTQLTLPNAATQAVETRLTGADTAAQIALNSEGQVTSKPQDKITIPLILALMASRPLDQDAGRRGSGDAGGATGRNAVGGAAGLSLVGTIIGVAGGSPYAAAGIGYWGAARAFYSRWIARGQSITFPRDTRIVVETTPRRSAALKP